MGEVVFFAAAPRGDRGIIHVFPPGKDGQFEIGQESRSGDSWGSFDTFPSAQEAVAAAYRLNREVYDNVCEVFIPASVMALLPITPGPAEGFF